MNELKNEEALKLKVLKDVLTETQQELDNKTTELDQIRIKFDLMAKELTQTQARSDSQSKELSNIQEKLLSTTEELSITQEKLNSLTRESVSTIEKIDSKEKELTQKITEIVDFEEKIQVYEISLSEFKNKIEEYKGLLSQKSEENNNLSNVIAENEKIIHKQTLELEEIKLELALLKPQERTEDYESEERLICAKCGAVGQNIKVEEDKMTILSYIGGRPMYAKKNVCKKCGHKF